VEVPITINVARSADEAERQAKGEDLTRRAAFDEPDEAEDFVEPAGMSLGDRDSTDFEAGAER
jgi:large subunit ribosomal protein L9